MKATELITQLQALVDSHGDCDVGIYSNLELEFEELDQVEPRRINPRDRPNFTTPVFFGLTTYEVGDWAQRLNPPET